MNIDKRISEALAKVDPRKPQTIKEAALELLTDPVSSGDTVATVHDDETFPYAGAKGRVIGDSKKGRGWTDVQYADGTTVPIQTSLLVKTAA